MKHCQIHRSDEDFSDQDDFKNQRAKWEAIAEVEKSQKGEEEFPAVSDFEACATSAEQLKDTRDAISDCIEKIKEGIPKEKEDEAALWSLQLNRTFFCKEQT